MGFGSIVRSGVAIADKLTGGSDNLQDDFTMYPWISDDAQGAPQYGAAISMTGVVVVKQQKRKLSGGEEVMQNASITILRPVSPHGATGRQEPIDTRDK